MLNNMQFDDLRGFAQQMGGLDRVEERPVYYQPKDGQDPEKLPAFKAVVSKVSGKVYSVPTQKYAVVQDRDVFQPLYDACKERRLKPIGRIDGAGSGRTKGNMFFANPEYTITLLKEYGDSVMLGVRTWNSYTGDVSFGGEVVGIRMVCVNFNLWGTILGRFRLTHKTHHEKVMDRFMGLVTGVLNNVAKLTKPVEAAAVNVVAETDVPDLLWGIHLPIAGIEAISAHPGDWEPQVAKQGLNAWTLYNAATAFLTYRPQGGMHLQATEEMTRKALDLLTRGQSEIIEHGKARKEAYNDLLKVEREKAAKMRGEQKATVTVPPAHKVAGKGKARKVA